MKIIIAINDDFTRKVYSGIFLEEKCNVSEAKSGKEVLDLVRKEMPDIILADVFLSELDGLELLKLLKKDISTQKIPVIIYTQMEREGDKAKAIELEARDFIVGAITTPAEALLKIRASLGEEKTYSLTIDKDENAVKELAKDLGYNSNFICPKCNTPFHLFLIRDLTKGKNYFKASFICPKCS